MSLLTDVGDALTGGLGKTILDGIKSYFPPDMSPEQKASLELATQNIELQKTIETNKAIASAEQSLNERIAMYEGTASDLKSIPILGPLMLFIRGAQRPVWGFAVLWMDYGVFSGAWKIADPTITNAFWIINFLVLGFLFGERAVTNIMPFFIQMMKAKQP